MTDRDFHITTQVMNGVTLHAGDSIEAFNGDFSTAIILGFNERGDALLARPYAYVSGAGTSGPRVLLGYEPMTLSSMAMEHYLPTHVCGEHRARS